MVCLRIGLRRPLVCLSVALLLTANLFAQVSASVREHETMDSNELYLEGIALAKKGQIDAAIRTFEKAVESDGRNPLLLDATGAAYSLKGDLERAKRYFLKCLDQDPGFVPARKNLAITYFRAGQYDLAAVEFHKLRDSSPASASIANLFLGMIAEKRADYLDSAKLLEQSGTLLDRYPEALLALAHAEFELAHLRETQEALAKLGAVQGRSVAQDLEAAQLYSRLAHVAQKRGDLGLAMESLRQAAKLDPTREDNFLDFSSLCVDYGNYPLALKAADIGLEHVPHSYRLLVQKGVVLENLGRFEESENTLREAGQIQKDNSVALLSLSIVQSHAGQLQDAESTLTSALKDFPDNYYMHYHLGKVLLQLEDANPNDADLNRRATQAFREAIRWNPSFADSYYQLAKLSIHASPKLAEQNLIKCLQLNPSHGPAEYALARLYLGTGRRAAGQALIDRFERQRRAEKLKENHKPRIDLAQD